MRVAQAGIESVEIGYEPLESTITAVGTVEFDERRMAQISQKIKGMARVDKLFVDYTGMTVEVGQPLAEVYSPELFQAVQELLLSRRVSQNTHRSASGRSSLGDPEKVVRLGVESLKRWGLTTAQIDQILRDGKVENCVSILSHISRPIINTHLVTGQYVNEGEAMFELADLSHVLILAKVPIDLIGEVRVGEKVEAVIEAQPGSIFPAMVAFIQPHVDTLTRTVDVRFDLENVDHQLRPGMFARVTMTTMVADHADFQASGCGSVAKPAKTSSKPPLPFTWPSSRLLALPNMACWPFPSRRSSTRGSRKSSSSKSSQGCTKGGPSFWGVDHAILTLCSMGSNPATRSQSMARF